MYISKDKASAPTVATKSFLFTCLIYAIKRRDIPMVDIPVAFMQSDMEGPDTYMKLEGKTLQILTSLDLKLYKNFITTENRKSIIYVKLEKALYRTIQAALLFWDNLTKTLKKWGFTISP